MSTHIITSSQDPHNTLTIEVQDNRIVSITDNLGYTYSFSPPKNSNPPPHETQASITQWADETFGKEATPASAMRRTIEEMEEFQTVLTREDIANEAADVVITMYRLASILGFDLLVEIDRKMAINRQRRWRKDGTGNGYHVKDGEQDV